MIDNFDELVARCNARHRKKMIRIAFLIVGGFLLSIAGAAGYSLLTSQPQTAHTEIISRPSHPESSNIKAASAIEADVNTTYTADNKSKIPINPSSTTPRDRLYSLQLTSSTSYDKTVSALRKVPEKYRSGMAIYFLNGYYTLRYSNIYDNESLPGIIDDFKQSGFKTPVAFKYNPDRMPITEEPRRINASNADVSTAADVSTEKTAVSNDVTPANPVQVLPVRQETATSPLFKVNSQKSFPTDPIKAYDADPKYETALAAAQYFYDKNEFSEAAKWAKKANQLNREAEEAWLLYAKSYYAQGRKNEAIGVLELYLNYKDSKAATELLRSWKRQ